MKTCRLNVSVRACLTAPSAAEGSAPPATRELLSGQTVTVGNLTVYGYVQCEAADGGEVWIAENFVSHAQ